VRDTSRADPVALLRIDQFAHAAQNEIDGLVAAARAQLRKFIPKPCDLLERCVHCILVSLNTARAQSAHLRMHRRSFAPSNVTDQ